jgi:hypothetical protein
MTIAVSGPPAEMFPKIRRLRLLEERRGQVGLAEAAWDHSKRRAACLMS